jgi:hypothetical protein
MVPDGDLRDLRPELVRERRQEAVHLAVEPRFVDDLGAVGLQRAAVVVQANPGHTPDQPVGCAGRHAARCPVLTVLTPAADDVIALVDLLEQTRDVAGVVLQIPVHQNDHVSRGVVEACRQGGRLPEIAPELDELESRIAGAEGGGALEGGVAAPVVDHDDLVGLARPLQHRGQSLVERRDALLLVVDGDDDGQVARRRPVTPRFGAGGAV